LCGGQIGFLDKAGNHPCAGVSRCVIEFAGLDVAVTGLGQIGRDAKGDHRAIGGQCCTAAHHILKCRGAGDHMVCRHHQQHRVCCVLQSCQCSQGQRWGSISAKRLKHHGALGAEQAQLLGNDKAVLFVAHHHGCGQLSRRVCR
jgi:hypothetical protein